MGLDLSSKRVALIGAGKIGGILLKALLEKGLLSSGSTCATVQHDERARCLSQELKIPVGTDNVAASRGADILFLCVKPQVVQDVIGEIRHVITSKQLIISVAASVPTAQIERGLGGNMPVGRAMRNIASPVVYGMTPLC